MAKRSRTALERAEQLTRLRTRPARAQLLAAARELATARGYESIKAGDIAQAAGVSRETFYTHFADKRSCLAEATEPRLGEIESELRIAAEEEESWAAPILETLEATLRERYGSKSSPRGRIIDAMLALVAEHGYSSVRLADVIKEAHVSYPSFYRHFKSKEACFASAYSDLIERLSGQLDSELDRDATPTERLSALAALLAAEPDTARLLVIEAGGQSRRDPKAGQISPLARLVAGPRAGENASLLSGALVELLRDAVLANHLEALAGSVDSLAPLLGPSPAQPPSPSRPLRRVTAPRRGGQPAKQRSRALAGTGGTTP